MNKVLFFLLTLASLSVANAQFTLVRGVYSSNATQAFASGGFSMVASANLTSVSKGDAPTPTSFSIFHGNWGAISSSTLSVEQENEKYSFNNFPNPFSVSTNFRFELSAISYVSLRIMDVTGSEVASPLRTTMQAGLQEFAFSNESYQLPSGSYIAELTIDPLSMATNSYAPVTLKKIIVIVK